MYRTPPPWTGYDAKSILSGSEVVLILFFFYSTSCQSEAKESSFSLTFIIGKWISNRIRTRVIDSISNDDNRYAKYAFLCMYICMYVCKRVHVYSVKQATAICVLCVGELIKRGKNVLQTATKQKFSKLPTVIQYKDVLFLSGNSYRKPFYSYVIYWTSN